MSNLADTRSSLVNRKSAIQPGKETIKPVLKVHFLLIFHIKTVGIFLTKYICIVEHIEK